jgi:hypothetical protein
MEAIVLSKRRRQRSPGSAGTAGRRRGGSRSPASSWVRGGEASEGSGWVGWPRPEPAGLAQPGGLGGLAGQLGLKANRPGGPSEFFFYQFDLI